MKHFLSISDHSAADIARLVDKGVEVAARNHRGFTTLSDKIVGIFFRRSSTRTRTSFSTGSIRLGASIVTYGPDDLQLNTGETPGDTARVLSEYLDALVIRTNDPIEEMRAMAAQAHMPIINAMSDGEHPTQVIGDLITIKERFGRLDGIHVCYLGEGNNTAASLAQAVSLSKGMKLSLYTPEKYGLDPEIKANAQKIAASNGAEIEEFHDVNALPKHADVVYTTRWETMGVIHDDPNWRDDFKPFKVTQAIMDQVSGENTIFMHDLPAIRGSDCDDEVLDGERSLAWRQALHKQTSAMVVLDYCVNT